MNLLLNKNLSVGCKILKFILLSPILCFTVICYYCSRKKSLIDKDISVYTVQLPERSTLFKLIYCLLFNGETFRNVFYYRVGEVAKIINLFLRENPTLHIMSNDIGGGLLIVHGDASYINPKKMGDNCYINQCVTIGVIGKNAPVIGNNVRISTGAIVLGNIVVGDNVNIGAGAVVVKNVPSNCTVVGNPARIVRLNGQKVEIRL